MSDAEIDAVAAWLVASGLAGLSEPDLLRGFGERCQAMGVKLSRALTIIDTLHPIYEGRAFRWRSDDVAEEAMIEYGRTTEGEAAAIWQRSVFYHLSNTGLPELRSTLSPEDIERFPQLAQLRDDGHTDYLAMVHHFASDGRIGEMDCIYAGWCSRRAGGFERAELTALRRLAPTLALAMKSASLARIAATLVEVYLGRDAGQRVLSGRILRGVADRINAVLWFSDLRGYTAISDTAGPDEILPLLNDYAEAAITAVHDAGGDVLKLIGDGVLAIFKAEQPGDACRLALKAEAKLRHRVAVLNARRAAEGQPFTSVYLGLHIGEVLYGNIGSADRLDFTVVGPAVNEVSRIASLCRSVDRGMVLSEDFAAAALPDDRARLVSVGRFALRGVSRARELFTLDPSIPA